MKSMLYNMLKNFAKEKKDCNFATPKGIKDFRKENGQAAC